MNCANTSWILHLRPKLCTILKTMALNVDKLDLKWQLLLGCFKL